MKQPLNKTSPNETQFLHQLHHQPVSENTPTLFDYTLIWMFENAQPPVNVVDDCVRWRMERRKKIRDEYFLSSFSGKAFTSCSVSNGGPYQQSRIQELFWCNRWTQKGSSRLNAFWINPWRRTKDFKFISTCSLRRKWLTGSGKGIISIPGR